MTKRKEERRELLREDEFHSLMERAVRYGQDNPNTVWVGIIGFVAVVVLIFGGLYYAETKKQGAATELYRAEKILNTDLADATSELKFDSEKAKMEAALVELDKVIASQSGVVRDMALVRKVRCIINLGRNSEVEAIYKELSVRGGSMGLMGLMGLGDFYLGEKQYAQAVEKYNAMLGVDNSSELEGLVKYKVALCYKEQGEPAKAVAELEDFVTSHEDDATTRPPIFSKAKGLLDELKAEDKAS